MIQFTVLNIDPYFDYRQACLVTRGEVLTVASYDIPSGTDWYAYWLRHLACEHSTLRCIHIRLIAQAPRSVVMQLIRATKGHPQPYVQSSRPDWTGEPRTGDPYEELSFIMDFTPESWLALCRQRLCNRTEARTRDFVGQCVEVLKKLDSPLLRALGELSVSTCVYRNGLCPELKPCCSKGIREQLSYE